jgi:ATP-dependent Clp protease adapter protein ClpS
MATKEEVKIDTDIEEMLQDVTKKMEPYNLILFNDSHHDMIQVARQIIKAIRCDNNKALTIMGEAHDKGQAVVTTGTKEEVTKAGDVLMLIDLAIDIVKA